MTLDHVGLSVGDLEGMAGWYSLAFDAVEDYRVERSQIGMRAIVLIDTGGFRFELLHREGSAACHGPETVAESLLRHGFGHVAIGVADVTETFRRLVGLGATPVMEPGPGSQAGMVIAFVADPEHNLIELVHR